MKLHYNTNKILIIIAFFLIAPLLANSQSIEMEYRNASTTATKICFEIWAKADASSASRTGEWNIMNLRMHLSLTPVNKNKAITLGINNVFSNYNHNYIDQNKSVAQNSVPGVPAAPYQYEYGLVLRNSKKSLPTDVFVHLVDVCIPVLGGTIVPNEVNSYLAPLAFDGAWKGTGSFYNFHGTSERFEVRSLESEIPLFASAGNLRPAAIGVVQSDNDVTFSPLNAYPNPTNGDIITLDINGIAQETACQILIQDATGKMVHYISTDLQKGNNPIVLSLEHLPAGLYFIQPKTNHMEWEALKIIKN